MSGNAAINARGLSKRYGSVRAVEDLDITVRAGEIYGFIGLNGAGKTTTIRMLLGLVRPDRGRVDLWGRRVAPGDPRMLQRVGCLIESATAYPNLTARENLDLQRRLTGTAPGAVDDALRLLRLEEYADRRSAALSLGNKQRLSLARALLHRPDLLILDEPANALDPAGIVEIRELLRRLSRERGVTIFVSSHILTEVAQLADRIGILHAGRLLEDLPCAEILAGAQAHLRVETIEPDRASATLTQAGFAVEEANGALRVSAPRERVPDVAAELLAARVPFTGLAESREDLEAYFLRRIGVGA